MEREIKFRGLCSRRLILVYGYLSNKDVINTEQGRLKVIPESVGQFTGLKDKNGKEIYEGDILHSNSYHKTWIAEFTPCDGLKLAIKHEDDFKLEGIVQTHEDWRYNKVSTCEIIGNIHEQK